MTQTLKLLFFLVAIAWMAMAASAGEAAQSAEIGLRAAQNARFIESTETRSRLLAGAATRIEQSWARPTLWHAGSTEALSALYALRAEEDPRPLWFEQSRSWSARTVALAPVQPRAWMRLAQLAALGYPNEICAPQACLATSWRVGPMMDLEFACARLQMAATFETIQASDERVAMALAGARLRRQVARCLRFLPPHDLFAIMLQGDLR